MSEKRFATKVNKKGHLQIIDREQHIYIRDSYKCVEIMNEQQATIEAKNEYQRTLEAKIRRLKNRIKVLEKNE